MGISHTGLRGYAFFKIPNGTMYTLVAKKNIYRRNKQPGNQSPYFNPIDIQLLSIQDVLTAEWLPVRSGELSSTIVGDKRGFLPAKWGEGHGQLNNTPLALSFIQPARDW